MSKQSLEVELDIDDVIERLASWCNPKTLTKLDIASTKDWNNLWKIPKHKLDGIVHPLGNESTIWMWTIYWIHGYLSDDEMQMLLTTSKLGSKKSSLKNFSLTRGREF